MTEMPLGSAAAADIAPITNPTDTVSHPNRMEILLVIEL
jgi:hypothetical protein